MRALFVTTTLLLGGLALAQRPAAEALLAQYRAEGAGPFEASRGQALWNREFPATDGGAARSCTTCHGPALTSQGRHARTGEPIEPMTAPERLTDVDEVEKWFRRNCRWTLGRECTAQEKGDLLLYLQTGGTR